MAAKGIQSFKQLEPSNLVQDLHNFLESQLPTFTTSSEFVTTLVKKKNENQHSSAFCLYMTNRSRSHYYFMRESSQKGSSTIDVGVYLGSTLIFTLEAKILPTPKGTAKNPRLPHEYVYGKGAGIQRFKEEKHGLDNEDNLLEDGGMIAYIKEKDFNHWHTQINDWIKDASWTADENLEILSFGTIGRLKSKHLRKNKSHISLHHFWIKVKPS
jgi:hypothetical protein